MRFLFLTPLGTKRHCHPVGRIAEVLRRIGHEYHVFIRENTRVELGGSPVLSKNGVYVKQLEQTIDTSCVSRLHNNVTSKSFQAESIIQRSDEAMVHKFTSVYSPDALLCCIDDLITSDDPIFQTAIHTAQNSLLFSLVPSGNNQSLLIDAKTGEKAHLPIDSDEKLSEMIQKVVLNQLDSKKSRVVLRQIINANADTIRMLENHAVAEISTAAPQSKQTNIPLVSLSGTLGEIESIKDNDVVFGDALWLKGWIDFSDPEIKCLIIHINESVHRCYPSAIRGDLAEKLDKPNVLSFEALLPIADEGSRLNIKVNLLSKNGREHGWKKIFLWNNDSIPRHYKTPVVLGSAQLIIADTEKFLKGNVCTEGYCLNAIRLFQFGITVGEQVWDETSLSSKNEFSFVLYPTFNQKYPVHVWLELSNHSPVFWIRLEPAQHDYHSQSTFNFLQIATGQVVIGEQLKFGVSTESKAERIEAFINGITIKDCMANHDQYDFDTSLSCHSNNLLVEVIDNKGQYGSCQLWRHPQDPSSKKALTTISIPGSARIQRSQCNNGDKSVGQKKVVVIRKSPAPTDELYILAPLKLFVDRNQISLTIVDTDANSMADSEKDAVLQPGAIVIVSRYITEDWIGRLTRKRDYLGPIFYLMDDDVAAAEDSRWLPGGYRTRMMNVAHGEFQTMLNLCDRFIVTCDFLQRRYKSEKTDLLEPPYLHIPESMSHLRSDRSIRIAYHGTMVHRDDVAAIAPALRYVHDKYSNTKIQIVMGDYVPSALKGLPRVETVPAMPWDEYKLFIRKAYAHIALAPILSTPYNLGKSVVKIMDIASLGAVGLYTRSEPYTKYISNGIDGYLLENDPIMWQKSLSWLVERPDEIRKMAFKGQDLAHKIGNIERLREYWKQQLDIVENNLK